MSPSIGELDYTHRLTHAWKQQARLGLSQVAYLWLVGCHTEECL